MAATPREALIGHEDYHLSAIAAEAVGPARETVVYSLVTVEAASCRESIFFTDFQGRKACFPGFHTEAGWETPVSVMIEQGLLPPVSQVQEPTHAAQIINNFFGEVCAPHDPKSDPASETFCAACSDDCALSGADAGPLGSVACMRRTDHSLAITDTSILMNEDALDGLRLLCPYKRECRDIESYPTCNFGATPTDMILVDGNADRTYVTELQSTLIQASSVGGYQSILGNTRDAGQLVSLIGSTGLYLIRYSRTAQTLYDFELDAP